MKRVRQLVWVAFLIGIAIGVGISFTVFAAPPRQSAAENPALNRQHPDFLYSDRGNGESGKVIKRRKEPALSPEQRERLRNLSPEKRQRIERNVERYMQQDPAQRAKLRKQWQRWKGKSPEERDAIRRQWEKYRKLSPEERKRLRRDLEKK